MSKLTNLYIRTESLPSRCEVCHQTDCFDRDQNWCSRCKGLSAKVEASHKEFFIKITANTTREIILGLMKLGLMTGAIAFVFLAFVWASAAESADAFLVLAILALVTGLVGGLMFGLVFVLGIIALNAIEHIKWRVGGKQQPLRQI